jgi:hypothetical protein
MPSQLIAAISIRRLVMMWLWRNLSPAWSNASGNWTAGAGVYRAQDPNNFPNAHSFVSTLLSLTDFLLLSMSMRRGNGGVWFRATDVPTFGLGVTGVLLEVT